jgi:hypothetical protein
MPKSRRTPSIAPHGDDQNVYLVLDDLGRLGRVWREANEHTDLEAVIRELWTGQYRNPIGVVGFNMLEGWSHDVSHDVAQELRRRCDLRGCDVPSDIQDFVDRHDAVDRSQLILPLRLARS